MANFISRARYYATSIVKWPFAKYFQCSNCNGQPGRYVDRKYLITALGECERCRILFRTPINTPDELTSFYLKDYRTDNTDTPAIRDPEAYRSMAELRRYRDYRDYIRVLQAAGCMAGTRVFEYGCSWGYGAAQLRDAGFEVTGYEISGNNREFARKVLGLDIVDDFDACVAAPPLERFDVFFSSHVLEHLSSVDAIFKAARSLVRPGGILAFFVPNGSAAFRAVDERRWRRLWGEVHPLFLTDQFFLKAFEGEDIIVGASPLDGRAVSSFVRSGGTCVEPLQSKELACLVRLARG
ncbi:MAG: class I SAM-dependent methyltransferase [Hyphomicrobiaceae bacterium]